MEQMKKRFNVDADDGEVEEDDEDWNQGVPDI
jgi:hypothetical protein